MLVSEFLTKVNYSLRGLDDDSPAFADDEATYWLDILSRKINELYQDITKRWNGSFKQTAPIEPGTVTTAGTTALTGSGTYFTDYQVGDKITVSGETERTIATIVSDTSLTVTLAFSNTASAKTFTRKIIVQSGVETYNLHRQFLGLSDSVYVLDSLGNKHYYTAVEAPERSPYVRNVYTSDLDPETITFTTDIVSTEAIVGGELVIPGYYLPNEITAETDLIPLPDPEWGVAAVAAEIAFNDITYEDRAEALNSKANMLYNLMVKKNRRGTYKNPRTTPYNIKRIPDTRR
jgi:hypothetical protein